MLKRIYAIFLLHTVANLWCKAPWLCHQIKKWTSWTFSRVQKNIENELVWLSAFGKRPCNKLYFLILYKVTKCFLWTKVSERWNVRRACAGSNSQAPQLNDLRLSMINAYTSTLIEISRFTHDPRGLFKLEPSDSEERLTHRVPVELIIFSGGKSVGILPH